MQRFELFTDEELDYMESAFCSEGLKSLVNEVRLEKQHREKIYDARPLVKKSRRQVLTSLT